MRRNTGISERFLPAMSALLSLVALGHAGAVSADVATYTGERRLINACVLVSSATSNINGAESGPNNPVPYLFYALESNTTYKPGGWTFTNPLAPSAITPDIYNRWKLRNKGNDPAFQTNSQEAQIFQIGAPLTKNVGAYWEVNLDNVADSQLRQFNVVFLPLQGGRANGPTVDFSPAEREKLRRFVDAGGTIWLENAGSKDFANDEISGQFIVRMRLGLKPSVNSAVSLVAPFHSMITYPYPISEVEAQSLGQIGGTFGKAQAYHDTLDQFAGSNLDPRDLLPIVDLSNTPFIYAGNIGAGHLIVSGLTIAGDINNYLSAAGYGGANNVAGGLNDAAVSGNDFGNIPTTDLKLFYNAIEWLGYVPTPGGNVRRTGSSPEIVGYDLAPKWGMFPDFDSNGEGSFSPTNFGSGVSVTDNVAFYIDGNNWLHAFDLIPQESLNNTLQTDDGLTDLSLGYPYDEIWNISLGTPGATRYATPSVYSVYTASGEHNVVVVTNDQGVTAAFEGLKRINGILQAPTQALFQYPTKTPNGAGNGGIGSDPSRTILPLPVPSSAYSDGVLFVPFYNASNTQDKIHNWHVEALDLAASVASGSPVNAFDANSSAIPTTQTAFTGEVTGLPDICGSLVVGTVQDIATGAYDEVVYAPTQGYDQNYTGQMVGLWFRTRGEPLQPTDTATALGHVRFQPHGVRAAVPWFTRNAATAANRINLNPVIHVVKSNTATGQILTVKDYPFRYNGIAPAYTLGFGPNRPTDSPTIGVANGQRYMEIDFNTANAVPVSDSQFTYTVTADYTVDWPGLQIGDAYPGPITPNDMNLIATNRTFKLYPQNGLGPMQPSHYMGGGAALAPDGALIFATTPNNPNSSGINPGDGLFDQISGKLPMPDRVYSLTDQFAPANQSPAVAASNQSRVNWMFAPTYPEQLNGAQIKARIVNSEPFGITKPQSGQIVDGKNGIFHVVGQPVVSNGVVYVVANTPMSYNNGVPGKSQSSFEATLVMAFQEQINNTITLPNAIPYSSPGTQRSNRIIVQQPDLSKSTQVAPNYISLTQGTDFTLEVETDANSQQYIRGITILNCNPTNQESLNVAMPLWVTDSTGQQQLLVNPTTGFGPLDNLLWYMVIPYSDINHNRNEINNPLHVLSQQELQGIGGQAKSSPAVFGQTLYFSALRLSTPSGGGAQVPTPVIVTVDLKHAAIDGLLLSSDTPPVSRVHVLPTLYNSTTGTPLASNSPPINAPSAALNTVLFGSADGMTALDDGLTVISDNNRLLQVDAASSAVWSLDATLDQTVVGGDLTNEHGTISNTSVPLSRPSTASLTAEGLYIVADSGNNRIVQIDRGGKAVNTIHSLNNDMGILRPGDPITLNGPTDVQYYTEVQANNNNKFTLTSPLTGAVYTYTGPYYARHYIIADSGNYRALEVVDIYDTRTGQPAILTAQTPGFRNVAANRQVIFTTKSLTEQNQFLRYRTIQQFIDVDGSITMIAAVDNLRQPQLVGTALGFGSDGSFAQGQGGSVAFITRAYGAGNGTDGNVFKTLNSITIRSAQGQLIRKQDISSPTWFKEFYDQDPNGTTGKPTPHFLLCDANGCYVLVPNTTTQELDVQWMLTNSDYKALTGRNLQAVCIQKLNQTDLYKDANNQAHFAPHYLITNAYTGPDNLQTLTGTVNILNGEVHGEVLELRGRDYYASTDPTTGQYNGYQQTQFELYTVTPVNGNLVLQSNLPALGGTSSIVRLIPAETIPDVLNGNVYTPQPIRRSIGTYVDSTSSYNLQQPRFSDRP